MNWKTYITRGWCIEANSEMRKSVQEVRPAQHMYEVEDHAGTGITVPDLRYLQDQSRYSAGN